ncbi:MAG: hypothetical protein JSW39_06505 [Desulfobacterales bacterium]|nr:MAG: hypothetical protein JSW39_06505 [Desulfobacterales bacterium]
MNWIEAEFLGYMTQEERIASEWYKTLEQDNVDSMKNCLAVAASADIWELLNTFWDIITTVDWALEDLIFPDQGILDGAAYDELDLDQTEDGPVPLFGGSNLVKNPGAEDGPSSYAAADPDVWPYQVAVDIPEWTSDLGDDDAGKGWIRTYAAYNDDDSANFGSRFPPPGGGSKFFMGGQQGYRLRQKIDLSGILSEIQSGSVWFKLEGDLGGYYNQSDSASIRFRGKYDDGLGLFEGAATTLERLGPVLAEDRNDQTDLIHLEVTGIIPSNLVEFFVEVDFYWVTGDWCDGYADNISLKLFKVE